MGRRNVWDPRRNPVIVRRAMDHLFDENWGRRGLGRRRSEHTHLLPVDVYSTPNELVIQASVPGLDPGDVEITIKGEALTIKVERRSPLENVDYHIQERRYGHFSRTLELNLPVEIDEAEAVFERGVLTLSIPKAEEARPKVIKVTSK